MAAVYLLSVNNWKDYNPRGDVKRPSWFRLEASFFAGPKFFGTPPHTRNVAIAIFCTRTTERKEEFEFKSGYAAQHLGISEEEICAAVELLAAMDVITLRARTDTSRGRDADVTSTSRGRDADDTSTCKDVSLRDGTGRDVLTPTESTLESGGRRAPDALEVSQGGAGGKRKPPPQPQPLEPDDLAIATSWAEFAREVSTTVRPNVPTWAQTVRLMRVSDKLTHDEIREMLAFAKDDAFWRDKAASLPGMRLRSKGGLLKHENLRAAMTRARSEEGRSRGGYDEAELLRRLNEEYDDRGVKRVTT